MFHPPASLLGLPPELRVRIFELLFSRHLARGVWTAFHIYTMAQNYYPIHFNPILMDNYLGILRTCRQIYNESMDVLYQDLDVTFCFSAEKKNCNTMLRPLARPSGLTNEMDLWRWVRRATFHITMEPADDDALVMLQRLELLRKSSLSAGSDLKELKIVLATAEDEAVPRYFAMLTCVLSQWKVAKGGKVHVTVSSHADVLNGRPAE
jgi:hypothetical protein